MVWPDFFTFLFIFLICLSFSTSLSDTHWIRRAKKSGLEIDWYDVTALTTNQDTHSAGRYVSCTILLTPFVQITRKFPVSSNG